MYNHVYWIYLTGDSRGAVFLLFSLIFYILFLRYSEIEDCISSSVKPTEKTYAMKWKKPESRDDFIEEITKKNWKQVDGTKEKNFTRKIEKYDRNIFTLYT